MISQTAEYALRAIVCLASSPGSPLTTQQIAKATAIPPGYLSKVLQALGRSELVLSYRGLNGGFLLSKTADQLTLLDVIRAVEPVQRIRRCPLLLDGHQHAMCALHTRLDAVMEQVEEAFRSTTISSMIEGCGLCHPFRAPDDGPAR